MGLLSRDLTPEELKQFEKNRQKKINFSERVGGVFRKLQSFVGKSKGEVMHTLNTEQPKNINNTSTL